MYGCTMGADLSGAQLQERHKKLPHGGTEANVDMYGDGGIKYREYRVFFIIYFM